MWYTNVYSNTSIKVYQKYVVTSIKEGCATHSLYVSSGPKAERVPTNNQREFDSKIEWTDGHTDKLTQTTEAQVSIVFNFEMY